MTLPILYMVIPCYNEEEALPITTPVLVELLEGLERDKLVSADSRIVLVDDGSRDDTWQQIEKARAAHPAICGLKLARNAGHQKALLAGLMYAKEHADCIVSLDADLQDDTGAIREFVLKFHEGYEVVYGVRNSRATDTWFKRWSAESFYKLMRKMGIPLVYNHADYRLMSRRAVEHLSEFQEVNLFLRGIVPLIGFRSTTVSYDRMERVAGESKYPLRKMLSFAWDGITSFSIKPMRLVTTLGFISLGASIAAGGYTLVSKLTGHTVSGWASLMFSVWFIGSIQLLALGVIGEYIGKIYNEVKRRPPYIVETVLSDKNVSKDEVKPSWPGAKSDAQGWSH
ncbi:glycosyltransferase family 2 protein [Paenibacillus alvei]|uniref:Glycosyltransferase family 2 protein n=1 Tax=Paenibacillus alvei TaxID=44250 RepID=A0AAP6ZTN2_PAEAL|nr:glycosyltransferase family 2 protein [Paenibacillus alvei]NEZ41449.1 glycosyltransferase [Paenibacillus alvei]NOJ69993.1 glycosyltransferase family 2 protein [Paenibacillus alvei]